MAQAVEATRKRLEAVSIILNQVCFLLCLEKIKKSLLSCKGASEKKKWSREHWGLGRRRPVQSFFVASFAVGLIRFL